MPLPPPPDAPSSLPDAGPGGPPVPRTCLRPISALMDPVGHVHSRATAGPYLCAVCSDGMAMTRNCLVGVRSGQAAAWAPTCQIWCAADADKECGPPMSASSLPCAAAGLP